VRGASSAVISQGITALASLVLQLFAARTLGAGGYGGFALCTAVLVAATALFTGWVGDSLTVLDRFDLAVRPALVFSFLCGCLVGFVVGVLSYGWFLGLLICCWLVEETGRRLLMARREFGKLVANDATYFVVSLVVVGVFWALRIPWRVESFLVAMSTGAAAAVALALLQLPDAEFKAVRPGFSGLRTVAGFASWRSAQATLRPASLLFARLLVAAFGSLAAVGALEGARLLLAPAQTVVNGAGSFLLPTFAAGTSVKKLAGRAVWILVCVVVLVGVVAAVLAEPLGWLVTGGRFSLPWLAIIGWAIYLATWAATLPYVSELVAQKRSREVFVVRVVDSALGAVLALLVLALGFGFEWVPWVMSVGGLVAALWLWRIARRTALPTST
jgi:O-antigen/teichoic acid export membrane protein